MKEFNPRLCVITDRAAAQNRPLVDIVKQAVEGGATMVQLREKEAQEKDFVRLGLKLLIVLQPSAVPLIVNDNLTVALLIGAAGLHIGQNDMPVAEARIKLGQDKILGVSVSTVAEALTAQKDGADYLGVGPVFATNSKQDAGEPIGLERLREIAEAVSIPVIAIGGINTDNAASVIEAGAGGIAVISAVMAAENPREATRRLRELIK